MADPIRSLLDEPRSPDAPLRVWRDWPLVAAVVVSAGAEAALRTDHVVSSAAFLPVALLPMALFIAALLWRRTEPLLAVAITFGSIIVLDLITVATPMSVPEVWSGVWVLILGYSLLRWGSGREIAAGLALMMLTAAIGTATDFTGAGDAVGGTVVLLFPAAVGAAVRWRRSARTQGAERIKAEERTQIARELHDTVAHHVSAIAVQAQAGQVLARSEAPEEAARTLEAIAEEASRALVEMRSILGLLRREGPGPDPEARSGIPELRRLESAGTAGSPRVEVDLSGDLDSVTESVGRAVYRLAQESVTNAVRHARHATRVHLSVERLPESVRLRVVDDGDPVPATPDTEGFGLVGMRERVDLLGGSIRAEPGDSRGWVVSAEIPLASESSRGSLP